LYLVDDDERRRSLARQCTDLLQLALRPSFVGETQRPVDEVHIQIGRESRQQRRLSHLARAEEENALPTAKVAQKAGLQFSPKMGHFSTIFWKFVFVNNTGAILGSGGEMVDDLWGSEIALSLAGPAHSS
jgi:hypothetical protein